MPIFRETREVGAGVKTELQEPRAIREASTLGGRWMALAVRYCHRRVEHASIRSTTRVSP